MGVDLGQVRDFTAVAASERSEVLGAWDGAAMHPGGGRDAVALACWGARKMYPHGPYGAEAKGRLV